MDGSSCTCTGSVRERRSGPAYITTIRAAMISKVLTIARRFMLVSVIVFAMGSNTPVVLKLAWNKVTSSKLPLVLFSIHVMKMDFAMTSMVNHRNVMVSQWVT